MKFVRLEGLPVVIQLAQREDAIVQRGAATLILHVLENGALLLPKRRMDCWIGAVPRAGGRAHVSSFTFS